jgi:hypothetical protein
MHSLEQHKPAAAAKGATANTSAAKVSTTTKVAAEVNIAASAK